MIGYILVILLYAVFLIGFGTFYVKERNNPEWVSVATVSGQLKDVYLPDSTLVSMAGNSTLRYDVKKYGKERRVVEMTGKAFFQVKRNEARPFSVHTAMTEVTVLGTSFQVSEQPDMTEVDVVTGKVRFAAGKEPEPVILTAGMSASYSNEKKEIENEINIEEIGSESLETLLDNELDYDVLPQADFMNVLFPQNQAEKNKAFLYKPVLACTIDHLMAATETKRGGKYILPSLRLSSSDLVIDEVDDFNGQDLIAIARLVHLAGMLGRKVMISSATIPPALAEGFFNAYQQGWMLYCAFKKLKQTNTVAMWVDEFKTQIQAIDLDNQKEAIQHYKNAHDKFVDLRSDALSKQVIKHKAYIIECHDLVAQKEQKQLEESLQQQYFDRIRQHIEKLHHHHHTVDANTGKKVSFGVVRVANIPPCVVLTQFLLNAEWSEKIAPRAMAYHSRQVLLLRSEQERHLDAVLKRKEKQGEQPIAFSNEDIRRHLDSTDREHVIFILVATPVEEVGRDHDFDWAIVEPSSYRSIIQLAGRVLRHRYLEKDIAQPNIGLLQYNLKGLRGAKVAFEKPGFEINNDKFKLKTKNLSDLIDLHEDAGINAIPRIQANTPLKATEKLADLEHAVLAHSLTNYKQVGAKPLNAWLTQYWFLTALPQRFTPFRQSSPNIQLFAVWKDHKLVFSEKDDFGQYFDRNG